jgi:organic hydroperoxide reductase OsmC/OhrA
MDRAVAMTLLKAASETCPYSRALHGNVDVDVHLA